MKPTHDRLSPRVENITDYAIYMLDPEGRVASWNAGARQIKGYEEDEIRGRHFSVFYVQDGTERTASSELLSIALREGHAASEGWRVRKSGERFWASVVITSVHEDGELVGFSKVTRDLTDKKAAEDRLRLSEERYRLLVDGVREYAIYSLDREGRVTSWNAGAARTKGYRTDEILGKHFSIFYPVLEIAAGAPQRELDIATRNGRHESEGWRLRKDGRRFWAHLVLTAIFDDGNLVGFSKVTRDISDQRRTEEALRRSEERYRLLIAGVRDYAILALDPDGTVASWNAGAEQIKGWAADEIIGRHFSAFYPPADVARCKPQLELEQAIATGRFEEEGWRVRKDGSRFWAHVVITTIREQDRVVGFSKVTRDVTDRKRTESSLQRTRHLLEASHSMSQLGGWELDLATDEMMWTDETYRIHDVTPATHTPTLANWLAFFSSDGIAEISGAMQRAMQLGEDFRLELPFTTASGRHGWVHVTSRVVLEGAQPSRIAGAIQDISLRKSAELEIRELNATLERRVLDRTAMINRMNDRLLASERAQQDRARELAEAHDAALAANRVKTALLANVSHEIRTPLAAVIGLADVLASTELSDAQAELLRAIRASGAGLLGTLNDILDFSKLEAGKLQPDLTTFSLARLIEDALDVVAVEAAEKGLDVTYMVDDDVPTSIVADFGRLRQILVNLIGNAVKFTARGEVVVSVRTHSTSPLVLGFAVRDTGIGIPETKRDRVFQSFSQVDGSTSREYGGTGLGLALSHGLVQLLGGSIDFVSEVGAGTTFSFDLPTEASPATKTAAPERVELAGRRILLVQRPETSRAVLARHLTRWGADVITVADTRAAIETVRSAVDLVLVDWEARAGDAELLAHAARLQDGRPPPSVLLRWRGPPSEQERPYTAIAWKPLRLAHVRRALRAALGGFHPSERPPSPRSLLAPSPLRVLVVEDNPLNQVVATHMLARLGHSSIVASDGLRALAILASEQLDAILMDVQLPGLDGLEITRRIVATYPRERRPWIIAMTANALSGDRERCLAAGMDDYLAKPVDLSALEASLARAGDVPSSLPERLAMPSGDRPGHASPGEPATPSGPTTPTPPSTPRRRPLDGSPTMIWSALDRTIIDELYLLGEQLGSPLLAELLDELLDQEPRAIAELERGIAVGELAGVRDLAHTLRGSCATIGARALAATLERLEIAADDRDACLCQGLLAELRAGHDHVVVAARELLVALPSPQHEKSLHSCV